MDDERKREPTVQPWSEGDEHVYIERNNNEPAPAASDLTDYSDTDITISVWVFFSFALVLYIFSEIQLQYRMKQIASYKQNTVVHKTTSDDDLEEPIAPNLDTHKNVFICAPLQVLDPCSDEDFGVHTDQPYLKRYVETYSWRETTIKESGVTKYVYKSLWSPSHIDST